MQNIARGGSSRIFIPITPNPFRLYPTGGHQRTGTRDKFLHGARCKHQPRTCPQPGRQQRKLAQCQVSITQHPREYRQMFGDKQMRLPIVQAFVWFG